MCDIKIPKRWQTNLKPGGECASLLFIPKGGTIAEVDRFDILNMRGFGQWMAPKAKAEVTGEKIVVIFHRQEKQKESLHGAKVACGIFF